MTIEPMTNEPANKDEGAKSKDELSYEFRVMGYELSGQAQGINEPIH